MVLVNFFPTTLVASRNGAIPFVLPFLSYNTFEHLPSVVLFDSPSPPNPRILLVIPPQFCPQTECLLEIEASRFCLSHWVYSSLLIS